ncbi:MULTISPECIES: conjugative transposon protein TraM [Sphingobacterium]|uniref:conjugative transposon protein TraM n=1 Tax=Sphingobacterium TaxID=28453 RepID=UPI00257ED76E|nr:MULTISPECIES: conjugative transposon protein TraM [Sphingobacterium]
MKETENKRISLLIDQSEDKIQDSATTESLSLLQRYKKPLIMVLFGIVFLGCMYLIFGPSKNENLKDQDGLNGAVPQATDAALQADKQKAYEQQLLEEKTAAQNSALTTLSDYWNGDSSVTISPENQTENGLLNTPNPNSAAINSYRNAQQTLGSFYSSDNNYESQQLKKEVQDLKDELKRKDEVPVSASIDNQLALMEKSYQMAAKYLPTPIPNSPVPANVAEDQKKSNQKESLVAVLPASGRIISSLYREQSDSLFLNQWSKARNTRFFGPASSIKQCALKNSIRAIVHGTQTITEESSVKLRLLEDVKTSKHTIPKGSILSAIAKIQGGRIQLKISSLETNGNILPVDILVYDLDGQLGLNLPYTPELNALSEVTANMSQSAGTNIMMSRSAGQQITGELGKGLIQGVSGFLSKKIRTPKVTLKDGYHVFLISKN